MKKFNEVKTLAERLLKSIDNRFCFSVEIDNEIPSYYKIKNNNYIDALRLAHNEYVNSIQSIETNESVIEDMISLELTELDDEDSVIEVYYLDTFEL